MEFVRPVAPPPPIENPPTWGQSLIGVTARVAAWANQSFQASVDYLFPEFVPTAPARENPRPILELEENLNPLDWDVQAIVASFKNGNIDHNCDILLRSAEQQIEHAKESPTKFYRILRFFNLMEPEMASSIATVYCKTRDVELKEGENFYEKKDISVKGIYDSLLYLSVKEIVDVFPKINYREQLQCLTKFISPHFATVWVENQERARLWFLIEGLKEDVERDLLKKMKEIDPAFKGESIKNYLKSDHPDLGLLRLASQRLLA